jgi:hypothetical protein
MVRILLNELRTFLNTNKYVHSRNNKQSTQNEECKVKGSPKDPVDNVHIVYLIGCLGVINSYKKYRVLGRVILFCVDICTLMDTNERENEVPA